MENKRQNDLIREWLRLSFSDLFLPYLLSSISWRVSSISPTTATAKAVQAALAACVEAAARETDAGDDAAENKENDETNN